MTKSVFKFISYLNYIDESIYVIINLQKDVVSNDDIYLFTNHEY